MNDVERELRELFERKAADARTAMRPPTPVLRRARRRQVGTVVVSSLTLLAVIAVSIAGARGILRAGDDDIPAGPSRDPFSRTATIQGLTITSPSDWVLINEWPMGLQIATSSGASGSGTCTADTSGNQTCETGIPVVTGNEIPRGIPVLQLTNFDPGLEKPICSPGSAAETGENAGLYVAIDADRLQGVVSGPEPPAWPVPYDQRGRIEQGGPCGAGWYQNFRVGDVPYMSFVTYGTPAPHEVLQTLIDAFESMSADPVSLQGSPDDTPGYVVAGGIGPASSWRIEVRPSDGNVDMHLIVDEQGGPGVGDFGVPSSANLEFAGGDPTFGAVTSEAEAVELRPSDGSAPIPGTIFGFPSSLNAPFDGFFIQTGGVPGDVVAIGPDGDLDRTSGVQVSGTSPAANVNTAGDAQSALRNALAAARTFLADGATYEGFTPKQAEAIEPSFPFNDNLEAVAGEVSIRDVSQNGLLLVTQDDEGAAFCMADDIAAGATTYGLIDARQAEECNGTVELWSSAGGVLTSPPPPVNGELLESLAGFGQVAALRIYHDENGFCLEFQSGATASASCGTEPFRRDRPYLALNRVEGGEGVWLEGTAPADVELVRIVAEDGRDWAVDLSGPAPAPELGDVQLLLVALGGTEGAGSISFEDGDGHELYDAITFDWPIPTNSGNEVL